MSELKDPITVAELVETMGYNGSWEGWTKEQILKHVAHYWKPLTAAQVGKILHEAKLKHEETRKRTVLMLQQRNKEYGALSAKYQKLKAELRKLKKEQSK